MTTNSAAQAKPARTPGLAARNIQAIWSHHQSANTSQPQAAVAGTFSAKDHYCADRATD